MEDLTQGWTKLGPFFQNQGNFFYFQKRTGEASPPSSAPKILFSLSLI